MHFVICSFFRITFLQINKELNIGSIMWSAMSRLKKRHHLNVNVRKRGSIFAKCIMWESLKDLISKLGRNSNDAKEYEQKLRKHLLHQESCKSLYHIWRSKLMWSKDEFFCVIHDKMDHVKTALPLVEISQNVTSQFTTTCDL